MMLKEVQSVNKLISTALYQIQSSDITLNFYSIHLCHQHTTVTIGLLAFGFVFHNGTYIYDITLMVVYKYLTISIISQHTLFPMLITAPLGRASFVPSKSPFPEDSKSKVSYIKKVKFHNFILTQNSLLNCKMCIYLHRMLILSIYMKFKHPITLLHL